MNHEISERKLTSLHSKYLNGKPARPTLEEPVKIAYETIGLAEHLGCRFMPTALEETYGQRHRSEREVLVGKALLVVGSALMFCTIAFYWIGTLLHNDEPVAFRITWGIRSLVFIGLMSIPIIGGYVLLKREKSRSMRNLKDLEHMGFETREMHAEFEAFRLNGLKSKPTIGFALTKGRLLTLPEDVWQSPDLALIIFGTERQRRYVLNAGQFALSSLVIKKGDLEKFEPIWEGEKKATNQPEPLPPTETRGLKTQPMENDTKKKSASAQKPLPAPTEPLSLRQKARGENTNWCPQIEMMFSDKQYLDRYEDQKHDLNSFTVDRQPCHRLLVLWQAKFEDFKLFFEKGELTEAQKGRLSKLDVKVRHVLGVVGQKNISRYNQFKIKKWDTLEKHIEDAGVISEEELVREYPHLKRFQESR